jgi:cytoskeletal protein CcmA (bactofilin family)
MADTSKKNTDKKPETASVIDEATLPGTEIAPEKTPPKVEDAALEQSPQQDTEVLQDNVGVNPTDELDSSSGQNQESEALSEERKEKGPLFSRLPSFLNIYFVVFLLLLAGAGLIMFLAFRSSSSNSPKTSATQSLTDKQLAALSGNTTVVGDSKHTLDIQSNSVFEGQVLMRSDLNIAGSIKVGGTLSLSSVTVGGISNLGQLQVGSTLAVAGNATIQGQVNIQKSLSVVGSGSFGGTLSAAQLNIGSLKISGDFAPGRHIAPTGGTPGKTNGSSLGGGGTASVSGTDTSGTVTINTGSGPPTGCFVSVNFTAGFNSTPHVVISPSNSNAGTLGYYVNRSASSFSICTATAPASARTYLFDYIVFD